MQTFTQVFAGGGAANQWVLEVPGRYFVILALPTNPVSIKLFYQGKQLRLGQIDQWTTGPLAGLQIGPLPADAEGIAFDKVVLTPTGADTCVVGIGDGTVTYNRAAGSVSITGPLAGDNADGLAALGAAGVLATGARMFGWNGATWDRIATVTVNAIKTLAAQIHGSLGVISQAAIGGVNALVTTHRGYVAGAQSSSTTTNTANTPRTIFAPGSNVNGAIIYRASFWHRSATLGSRGVILAKTSAPTGVSDGAAIVTPECSSEQAGTWNMFGTRREPIFLAAGLGLYFICDVNEAHHEDASDYTLL